MEFDILVSEIVRRVSEKLAAAELSPASLPVGGNEKPALLVLTQDHGTICHKALEHPQLNACYRLVCAKLADYDCDMRDYEAVILFDLTVDAMAKLAGGVCDTPFTALAQKAILQGKKLFVPDAAIELLTIQKTVPSVYYQMLREKLTLLEQSGVAICPLADLAESILSGDPAPQGAAPVLPVAVAAVGRTVSIAKKVVTERDIAAVYERGVSAVHIAAKAIVTDLAREYAAARRISMVRD